MASNKMKKGILRKLFGFPLRLFSWSWSTLITGLILAVLFSIVVNFYLFASLVNFNTFIIIFLILSGVTDATYILIHFPRKKHGHENLKFDPHKLTVLIACYNGADVIAETIKQASQHVPPNQIIIVSDASTDNTIEVARKYGARVIQNKRNVNKAFSISFAMKYVKTPYVLIVDDDTLIGDTFIPTSLLDDGYTAVAFNVMPVENKSLINKLQVFEYRKSMVLGKELRSRTGAIGNISGAMGLYRTDDLLEQARLHSGQFGGEDEQRTALTHLHGIGRGIVYTDSTVRTIPPKNLSELTKQRTLKWNLSLPEMFVIYWRILLHPDKHYLLKTEKAYQIYIYLTDPLRMLFFWVILTKPSRMLVAYIFYLVLTFLVWLRIGRKDPLTTVILFPLYTLYLSACRFYAYFYWFVIKFRYIFHEKFHRLVKGRRLLLEYTISGIVILIVWVTAVSHFAKEVSLLQKIQNAKLDEVKLPTFDEYNQSALPTDVAPPLDEAEKVRNRKQ